MNDVAVKRPSRYGAPEVTRALTAVAYANGNTRLAAEALAEDGIQIHHTLLWQWQTQRHTAEYARIREEIMPRVRQQAGDEHLDLAARQMAVNRKILKRLDNEVDDLPAKELPGASRNMSVGAAVETEKAQLLHNQPTQRTSTDLPSLLREMKSLGVEPSAVIDAVVVEDDVSSAEPQPNALEES